MVMTASMRRYLNDTRGQGSGQMASVRARQEAIVGERVPDNLETRKYEDFGLIMNPDQYGKLTSDLAASAAERKSAYGKLDAAEADFNAQVAAAQAEIDALGYESQSVDPLWNEYYSGFKPVRVVSGSNVEGTYMLPDEVISGLGGVFNKGDGTYTANWVDGGKYYNIDVTPRGTDDAMGKELHEMLGGAVSQTKSAFYDSAQGQVDLANKYGQLSVDQAKEQQSALLGNQVASGYDEISQQRASIKAAEAAEKKQLQDAKDQFNQRVDTQRTAALGLRRGVK